MERRSRTLSSPRAAIGSQRSIRRVSGIGSYPRLGCFRRNFFCYRVEVRTAGRKGSRQAAVLPRQELHTSGFLHHLTIAEVFLPTVAKSMRMLPRPVAIALRTLVLAIRIVPVKYRQTGTERQVQLLVCAIVPDFHARPLHGRRPVAFGAVNRTRNAVSTLRGFLRCIAIPSQ